MANIIQVRRGSKADLPTLAAGEFGLTTDTDELYIGNGVENILVPLGGGSPVTKVAYKAGLRITRKDDDELYVDPGSINIGGTDYKATERLTVSCAGEAEADAFGNPAHSGSPTFSNNDRTALVAGGGAAFLVKSVKGKSAGKLYAEFKLAYYDNEALMVGIVKPETAGSYVGQSSGEYGYCPGDGSTSTPSGYQEWDVYGGTDDVVMIALDLDNGKIWWGVNGTWFNSGDPAAGTGAQYTGISGTYHLAFSASDYEGMGGTMNFGQAAFAYTAPSGFGAWLGDPAGLAGDTFHYVYVDEPASGDTLAADDIEVSTTAPAFSTDHGAFYKTGDATQRLIGRFLTDGSGYIVAAEISFIVGHVYITAAAAEALGASDEVDGSTSGSLSSDQLRGTVITNYGQGAEDVFLELCAAAKNLRFRGTVGTAQTENVWGFKAAAGNKFYLDGEAGEDGGSIKVTPAIGDWIDVFSFKIGSDVWNWMAKTGSGTWSAEAPSEGGTAVWSFGKNADYGQLGLGDIIDRSSPVQVGSDTDWAMLAAHYQHTLAIKTDGTLWAWGNGLFLGLSESTHRSSPVQIGSGTDWAMVATDTFHAAVKTDGTLWTWGINETNGQLGHGDLVNCSFPVQVGALTDWSAVSCGSDVMLAIKTDGTLWACGMNSNGQLGLGDIINRSSPVQVGSLTDWAQVDVRAAYRAAAIKTDGTLWTWGDGYQGALGLGNDSSFSSPVQVGSLTDWSAVTCGIGAMLAIKTDGTLWAWGGDDDGVNYGELGLGDTINRSSPVQVGSLTDWSTVSCWGASVLATKKDGTLWAWGGSWRGALDGQLGLGDILPRSSPVQVGALTTWSWAVSGELTGFAG